VKTRETRNNVFIISLLCNLQPSEINNTFQIFYINFTLYTFEISNCSGCYKSLWKLLLKIFSTNN